MRAFLCVVLLMVGMGPATAQGPLAETRDYLAWAAEAGQASREVLALIDTVFEADELGVMVRDGVITLEEGEADLAAWRARQGAELQRLALEVARLRDGPSSVPAGREKTVDTVWRSLQQSMIAVEQFIDQAEAAARRDFSGKPANDNLVFAARYGALQEYYTGQLAALEANLDFVEPSHPQHGLSRAMIANLNSTILALEMGRDTFGAAPSSHAVDNPGAVLEDNQQIVEQALVAAEQRYQAMRGQYEAMRSAGGETARLGQVVLAMLATYPVSFEVERQGAAAFVTLSAQLAEAGADGMFAFANTLIAYEEAREAATMERVHLASEL